MRPKNPLSELTDEQKFTKFAEDIKKRGMFAYTIDGGLYLEDQIPQNVDFIGGLWRVQNRFNHKITKIHDKEFVIGEKIERSKLPKEEIPIFDYYTAATLGLNCYGYILGEFNHIVANCGKVWAYGKDIAMARSKLSGKVMDLIMKNPVMSQKILTEMSNIK